MGQTLQRRQALAEYLAQVEEQETDGYPDVLRAGASALALDAWETSILEKALNRSPSGQSDWASLLLESVVVRGKYEDELRSLRSADSLSETEIAQLENELINDAAVGLALVRETTKAIASMNIVGQKDDARRLSGFLHKLGASVAEIRDRIGPDGYSHAEKLSREMLANAVTAGTPGTKKHAAGPGNGAEHTPQPGNAERKRRTLLTAHLAQLDLLMATEGQEAALENHAGARGLKLDAWEKAALSTALSAHPGNRRWIGLIAECVAFQSKYLAERDAPGANAEIQQTTNTALGLALVEELQREINGAIRESKSDDAKRLSGFRNKLSRTVNLLRDQIDPQILKTAEAAAQNLVSPIADVEPREEDPSEPAEAAKAHTTFRRETAAPRYVAADVEQSRARPLAIVLAIVLGLWGVFVAPRYLTKKIPTLKQHEMPASPAFLEMTARPPSLFVQVQGGVWSEMTDRERTEFVQAFADRADAAGYTGAQFRSTEGHTVAQWLSETGIRLHRRPVNPS